MHELELNEKPYQTNQESETKAFTRPAADEITSRDQAGEDGMLTFRQTTNEESQVTEPYGCVVPYEKDLLKLKMVLSSGMD